MDPRSPLPPSVQASVFHHVTLPAQLPQRADNNIAEIETALVDYLLRAANIMKSAAQDGPWESISRCLERCKTINMGGLVERTRLTACLRQMVAGDFLVIRIAAQNAAVFVRLPLEQTDEQFAIFEFFETSANREDVMQSPTGTLSWTFPGSAVAVSKATFEDDEFVDTLSGFLEQASMESAKHFTPVVTKAGSSVLESRDTVDPSLITALLTATIDANGQRCQATLLHKKVRDDVCWNNAARPWRRLPYWLVQRVTIARYLQIMFEREPLHGRLQYKAFQCVLHCLVLDGTQSDVSLEDQAHLKSKVCRRLFKLDRESANWPTSVQSAYASLMSSLRDILSIPIDTAGQRALDAWQRDIPSMIKTIPMLPKKAEADHLRLQLVLSRPELMAAQERFRAADKPYRSRQTNVQFSPRSSGSQVRQFALTHSSLFQREDALRQLCTSFDTGIAPTDCSKLKSSILGYIESVGGQFDNNVELKSSFLLTVFEAWMSLDKMVCQTTPLLSEYDPGFQASMLDVLNLPRHSDMLRARRVQDYLQHRKESARYSQTVLDDPRSGCFAEKYFDTCDADGALESLLLEIRADTEAAKQAKESQWRELTAQFDSLTRQYEAGTCLYVDDGVNGPKHEAWQCPRCQINKRRNRIEIRAFEDPLPQNDMQAKVVVFELMPPENFVAYRDATWAIWYRLGFEKQEPGQGPRVCLWEYSGLRCYIDAQLVCGAITLASTTKSFLMTHYATATFPVGLDQVIRPNALKYGYYHDQTRTWPGRLHAHPKLLHHCKLTIPPSSPYATLLRKKTFAPDGNGPSSYEIIANHTSCPPNLNAQEFSAFQSMLSGKAIRWITILVELASPNLNMSSADSVLLLKHLSAQLGPADPNDSAGVTHSVFRDPVFCQALLRQLRRKLADIKDNWREMHLMEVIITLSLRIATLAAQHSTSRDWVPHALQLLESSRDITRKWMRDLRSAGLEIVDVGATKQNQCYTLWAAILCKRTFAAFITAMGPDIDSEDLAVLIECSATSHDATPEKIQDLPLVLQQSLTSDLRLQYQLKQRVERALAQSGAESLLAALKQLWIGADTLSDFEFEQHDKCWVTASIHSSSHHVAQSVQYNSLYGVLLVDGEPLTRLAPEPENEAILTELFGVLNLRKRPSALPGMTYELAFKKEGHSIHVGYVNRRMIIRAVKGRQVMELISRNFFHKEGQFDLPSELVDDCFHWLDLKRGILEIRPKWSIWWSRKSQWKLDVSTSACYRDKQYGSRDSLVDPYSPLFARVARLFNYFEYKRYLTVFQPARFALTVDMKRMQLRWHVNDEFALQSRQLSVQIDFNQDIGTWYGFRSALVCKNINNPDERSVLVPLRPLKAVRHASHVYVHGIGTSDAMVPYIRYTVNSVLGRLDCVAEPALVYKKAEIHALTSGMLADPLTRRTGAEEALSILSSGLAQPWTPLANIPSGILHAIARISPLREWYPEDKQVMQRTLWNPDLPCHAQREEYPILVHRILERSARLSTFHLENGFIPLQVEHGNQQLRLRALRRRDKHRRPIETDLRWEDVTDSPYLARDRPRNHGKYARVFEIITLLRQSPSEMPTCTNLAQLLSEAHSICGFTTIFDRPTISEKLDVSIRGEWGSLVHAVRKMEKYPLMFFLGTIAYGNNHERELLRTLVAHSIWEPLRTVSLPSAPTFNNFRPHQNPQLAVLTKLVEQFKVPAPADPELAEYATNKQKKNLKQAREAHERKATEDCEFFVRHLLNQWPCEIPQYELPSRTYLLDITAAYASILPEWTQLYTNRQLSLHLDLVQGILNEHTDPSFAFSRPDFHATNAEFPRPTLPRELPTLTEVLTACGATCLSQTSRGSSFSPVADSYTSNTARGSTSERLVNSQTCLSLSAANSRFTSKRPIPPNDARAVGELAQIVKDLSRSASLVQQRYAADLGRSLEAFVDGGAEELPVGQEVTRTLRSLNLRTMRLLDSLMSDTATESYHFSQAQIRWLYAGKLWPVTSPITLLEQLRESREPRLDGSAKAQIIEFALSIIDLQRALRMEKHEKSGEKVRWREEQANPGHRTWNPTDYPDWLLLEIESDILIRDGQVEVAQAIIAPQSGKSSVLQLNMGQGKTSCIIPMVATVLADGENLVRVCVPKALLQQTAQLLQTRLGGLVGRRIGHVPFSRKTTTDEPTIKQFQRLHVMLQKDRGVMICLPEHQLSFSLSTSQRVLDDRVPEARLMARFQKWLQSHARDILDESDHTLAVRTQLIYPSGPQTAVDGHPHRWLVAEQVLALVELQLDDLQKTFPRSIEVVRREAGGFPHVFFLRSDVEEELIRRLTWDICRGHRGILPIDSLDAADRSAIKEFLTSFNVEQSTLDRISGLCPDQAHIRSSIMILRGLLLHRILLMTLKKRYGVTYGLHETRDPVAVPFHAKGVPSDTSEFGHVDVSILLTCLAFYHKGLNTHQIREALGAVLKSDDPAAEYDNWCDHDDFPDHLRNWHAVNAGDERQIADIHQFVQFKVVVIDYYLNNFVFPRHAKQFKVKLQSSGWDIPLFKPDSQSNKVDQGAVFSKTGRHLTTGFSGTNDIKPLLPLTISQDDIPSLLKTNAKVLTYLLQPRSRNYRIMRLPLGKRMSEEQFLFMLKSHGKDGIRILIDSGAQILEMTNAELVQKWLKMDGRASAALYFSRDRPYIMSKTGTTVPLSASPYADNLKEVLVYLDEAHTRGTDLRFDRDAHAALTLGLGQTKDHTVQAAMRLRQLGTTQSVTFFAPVEVDQSIRDLCKKELFATIDSSHVIKWLVHNTCSLTESLQPLYFAQGMDFCARMQAAVDHPDFLSDAADRREYIRTIRQTERQTLQQLYAPQTKAKTAKDKLLLTGVLGDFRKELNQRRKRFQDTGHAVHASALEEVEQEREIEQEVEAVRQVKKPLPYTPFTFPGLHRDVENFARTGRFAAGSDVFVSALTFMARSSTGRKYKVNSKAGSAKLFVTMEFTRTVRIEVVSTNDNFIRPVQWILYSPKPEAAVVVTPEEAECLVPILRRHGKKDSGTGEPATYLITYAGATTRRMRTTVGSFKFYSIPSLPTNWSPPPWLKVEVGVLAGRLYFDWDEYAEICKLLGIADTTGAATNMEDEFTEIARISEVTDTTSGVEASGPDATSHSSDDAKAQQQQQNTKPFSFTRDWLSVRRHGQEFSHSPMGFLCLRKPLHADHAFFEKTDAFVRREDLKPGKLATMNPTQLDGAGGDYYNSGDDDGDGNGGDHAAAALAAGMTTNGGAEGEMVDFGEHDPSAVLRDDDVHVKIRYESDEDGEDDVGGTMMGDVGQNGGGGEGAGGAGHSAWASARRLDGGGVSATAARAGRGGRQGRGGRSR
ncbi:uncharacterized protein B0I36DRAFT_394922 [Microdochium trichocladiopsis]|uniref:ubiquitinyl hydrolase 1 n=1 Tax=Microdochium trichocladiopsis TaxID=1682393 RepID=A0A9P8XVN6_9PEZI|nr:uncharacterized protein B0I36DRAFT_394922 [Microdochium trichocladiopsis]KAH7018186.1 hypothetical protein B0I36DRAFT_394922 [Microdochium trichocladiopsis]